MNSLLLPVLALAADLRLRVTRGRDERGASAVEYGLLITGIAALLVLTIFIFGDNLARIFTETCDSIEISRGNSGC